MKNEVSALSRINYNWQSFALLLPIYILLYTLMQSFADLNSQGIIIFSVMIGAILCNELLVGYNILTAHSNLISTTCGLLNFNKNFYMTNSTIILSLALAFYGLNMYFVKSINLPFLILLSFFLLMDIIYYVLICSGDGIIVRLITSILFGGAFGITWSYIHNKIFDNNEKRKRRKTIAAAYLNGVSIGETTIDE
jgi:hypothetical protein